MKPGEWRLTGVKQHAYLSVTDSWSMQVFFSQLIVAPLNYCGM